MEPCMCQWVLTYIIVNKLYAPKVPDVILKEVAIAVSFLDFFI